MAAKSITASPFEEPTTANFHFREKGKVQPQGYEGLGVDETVTVMLKGKIRRIGVSPWESGKGFELEITACEITKPAATGTTLADALAQARQTGRRVK